MSYCPKCKMSLAHTIMAMDGEKTAQVTCTTCGSSHPFKSPADAPKARVSRAKKRVGTSPSVAALWEARVAAASGEEHVYTRAATYRIGDIVLHEQFGKGVVLKLSTDKCYVLFQDKERLMASAN
jgi:uncharacterized Zn finger protein (UPF0148 family)